MKKGGDCRKVDAVNEPEVRAALAEHLTTVTTGKEFAKKLGTSAANVSAIKHGRKPMSVRVAREIGYKLVSRWEKIE